MQSQAKPKITRHPDFHTLSQYGYFNTFKDINIMLVSIALHQHLKRLNTYKGAKGNKETKK